MMGIAGCCARAASGHALAPPISLMKSRRLISSAPTEAETLAHVWGSAVAPQRVHVRFGSKAAAIGAYFGVRFTPESCRDYLQLACPLWAIRDINRDFTPTKNLGAVGFVI
jgi:hypothetical protein